MSSQVIVKFRQHRDPQAAAQRIKDLLGEQSVALARQVFPENEDEQLATIYEVQLAQKSGVQKAVAALSTDDDVEYAHVAQERFPA